MAPGVKTGGQVIEERRLTSFCDKALFIMHLLAPILLFALNLLDALLTIIWVRAGVATEGNGLMASLLDISNWHFLAVKIGMGAFAAVVLYYGGNRRLARYGLAAVIAIYISLMAIHLFTGLTAFGLVSNSELRDLLELPGQVFALIT